MSRCPCSGQRYWPILLAAGWIVAPLGDFAASPAEAQFRRPVRNVFRGQQVNLDAVARNAAAAVVANLAAANAAQPPGTAPDALIAVPPEGTTDKAVVEQVRSRLTKDAEALKRRRAADGKPPLAETGGGVPRAMIDMAHYGMQYGNQGPQRFFALHLIVDNPSDEPLTIPRGEVAAKIDGEAKPLADIPDQLKNISFPYGSQQHSLQNQQQIQEFKVPAQGVGGTWLVYPGLPMNAEVPPLSVAVRLAGRLIDIDVTASQWAMLDLSSETIGPRGCLQLISLNGMLNTVNIQSLVEHLERLTEQKTVRFVLLWKEGAAPPEQQLSFWLVNSAMQLGSGRPVNDQFPSFPALIREFHIIQPAGNGFPANDQYGRPNLGMRLHKSAADGVGAALKSAYLALPTDELLEEIQKGHPLSRAAALRHGAGKLKVSHLPVILRLIEDPDVNIQISAIRALSHFGEPAAWEALVRLAKKKTDPHSMTAIESLAGSRYAVAQAVLLDLLKENDAALKKQILLVLARYPRPQWSETIFASVTDPMQPLTADGVRALLQVGHPRLMDVLESGLKSPDKSVRDLVFPILAQRTDVRSERLATEYTLAHLEKSPPDGTIIQFLHRTKLAPAVPLLLKHLETAPDKGTIISLLTQIGDETVGDVIAGRYEKFQNNEKHQALNALRILKHGKFREFAGEALLSNDGSVYGQATQGLMQDGGPEACQLLITALEKQTNNNALHNICNALGNLGRPEGRAAMLKARESDNAQRKNAAINGLNIFYQRSPGYQYIWQAQNVIQQQKKKNWKEALEYYDMSLQIDPELPEALAGRGCMQLRLGKSAEAAKDLEKAFQLDPFNHLAIPGLAEVRITAGKLDEGLKILETGRERYQHDGMFLHGSGRAYALAAAQIDKQKDIPDREQKRSAHLKKAVADFQLAVTRGFGDLEWLRDDPDLKPLQDDPEFKKLLGNRPNAPAAKAVKEAAVDAPADAVPEK